MKITVQQIILVLMVVCLTGCGTLFTGTTQTVQINSVPAGATVQVNGADRGQTPLPVSLKKGSNGQMISLCLSGYQNNAFCPQSSFNSVSLLNLFFPLPWIIDACSGGMYKYDPTVYNIQLQKVLKN